MFDVCYKKGFLCVSVGVMALGMLSAFGAGEGVTLGSVEMLCPEGLQGAPEKEKKTDVNVTLLKKLKAIEKGGDVNAVDKKGQTALMFAAKANNRLAICWLVAKGADVTLKTQKGKTALDYTEDVRSRDLLIACENDDKPLDEAARKAFKERNANDLSALTAMIKKTNDTCFPGAVTELSKVMRAGGDKVCQENEGLSINECSAECLAYLVRHGYKMGELPVPVFEKATHEKVLLICALGAQIDKKNPDIMKYVALACDDVPGMEQLMKERPQMRRNLDLFAKARSADMARLFLSEEWRPDVWQLVAMGNGGKVNLAKSAAALMIAEGGVNVNAEDNNGNTLLCQAIGYHSVGIAQALIEAGADVSKRTKDPALLINCRRGGNRFRVKNVYPLHVAVANDYVDVEVIESLIKAGADVNASISGPNDSVLKTALNSTFAGEPMSVNTHMRAIRMLLKAGAKVQEDVLLSLGTLSQVLPEQELMGLIDLLVQQGADINAKNQRGLTVLSILGGNSLPLAKRFVEAGIGGLDAALETAVRNNHAELIEYLISNGAKVDENVLMAYIEASYSRKDISYEELLKTGRLLEKSGTRLADALWMEGHPNPNAVKAVLALGADVIKLKKEGKTALMAPYAYETMDILIAAGGDVNAQSEDTGETPLMYVVRQKAENAHTDEDKALEAMTALLNAGAKTDLRNKEGKSVLTIAKESSESEMVKLLEERGAKE